MQKKHPKIFKIRAWSLSNFQKLSGMTPALIRDWRRRGLAPESEGGKLKLESVAQLLLLSELTAHGFGPKRVKGVAEQFSDALRGHALQHRSAWVDDRSHAAWLESSFGKKAKPRFIVIESAGDTATAIDDLSELNQDGSVVVSIIDLERLGRKLGERLAQHPSALADSREDTGQ